MRIRLAPLFTLLVLLGGVVVSGCSTMEGMGQDVEDTGEAIEDEASD